MLDLFGNEIIENKIIDRDILTQIFIKNLKDINEKQLVNIMYSKFEAIMDFSKLCNREKTGQKISMIFNPHRYNIKTKNSISIIKSFENESFLNGLARAILFKDGKYKDLLYQTLQLGVNGIQYVNEFPPHIAQKIYIDYSAKKILDPCAGWGGRMIGAASIGAFYHGFEPSTLTFNGLKSLGDFLKSFNNGFDYKIECKPFEDVKLHEKYDIAFTSPPYYDTEIYSSEITNSCNRYNTFDKWCQKFYIPMVKKSINFCEVFILNIGTRKYPLLDILYDNKIKIKDIGKKLSGLSGLNKKSNKSESFYLCSLL